MTDELPLDRLDESAYRRHAPRLMALAAALVGPADAGDIVSATITRVLAAGRFDRVDNVEAYLTRAVVNEARSWARAAARRGARQGSWQRANAQPTDITTRTPVDPELATALLRLPLRQRAVVFLTYWADLPPDAVARQLGIGEGSVRKHLARARAALRDQLSEESP